MANFTPLASLLGGMLVGLACIGMVLLTRRVMGITGIVGGMLTPTRGDLAWRLAFTLGMIGVGSALYSLEPDAFSMAGTPPTGMLVIAGLLVGFGARLGSGCTSGHGVCGVGRLSRRSMVATGVFTLTAFLTVWAVRALGMVA